MKNIYELLEFPIKAKADKTLDIARFLNKQNITETEKIIFKKMTNSIEVKYLLNDSTTNLKNAVREQFEYKEIIVIEVDINNPCSVYDVAIVIGRSIIYPTILFLKYKNKYKIGVYNNKEGIKKIENNIVSDIVFTGWLDINNQSSRTKEVIENLNYKKINGSTFYVFYKEFSKQLKNYKGSYISLEDAINFLNIKNIYTKKDIKLKLMILCTNIKIDKTISKNIELFKTDRIDKYTRKEKYNYVLICLDEFYSFVEKNCNSSILNYNTLINSLKNYYKQNKFNVSTKQSLSLECIYYNGYSCENYSNLGRNCIGINKCIDFRRRR